MRTYGGFENQQTDTQRTRVFSTNSRLYLHFYSIHVAHGKHFAQGYGNQTKSCRVCVKYVKKITSRSLSER